MHNNDDNVLMFCRKFANGRIDEKPKTSNDTQHPEAGKFRTILPQVMSFCLLLKKNMNM